MYSFQVVFLLIFGIRLSQLGIASVAYQKTHDNHLIRIGLGRLVYFLVASCVLFSVKVDYLRKLLLLSGDIERNPGPEPTTNGNEIVEWQFAERYDSREAVKNAVSEFASKKFVPLSIRSGSTSGNQIIYQCKHGFNRRKQAEKVAFTHSYYTGCPCRLSFTRRKNGFWYLCSANFEHRKHAKCCEENFNKYNQNSRPSDRSVAILKEITQNTYFKPKTLAEIAKRTGRLLYECCYEIILFL